MEMVHRIPCGNGNCYILENGTAGILIDTGKKEFIGKVEQACRQYHVRMLLLTHAHFDHAENAAALAGALGLPIAMSEYDRNLISSNHAQSLSANTFLGKIVLSASQKEFSARPIPVFRPDIFLRDGDDLLPYGLHARIIALPGHTDGSIGVDAAEAGLIVGDALMNMFFPTVSMLYHDREQMIKSAKKISALGERTIYFGHGKPVKNRHWA